MNLSFKKIAASFTASVCMLVPLCDTACALVETAEAPHEQNDTNAIGFSWDDFPGASDPETPLGQQKPFNEDGTWKEQTGWNLQTIWGEPDVPEDISYPSSTPDPTEEELKADHISGQSGAFVYTIDKKSGKNGKLAFSNGTQNGFRAGWSDMESLTIEKCRRFKTALTGTKIRELALNYKVAIENFSGEQFEIGVKCQTTDKDSYLYFIDHFGEFAPDEDMEKIDKYISADGRIYDMYKKPHAPRNDEADATQSADYYCIYCRDTEELQEVPDIVSTVSIYNFFQTIQGIYVPSLLSCSFYVNSCGSDADIDVKYIQLDENLNYGTPGMKRWSNAPENADKAPCILYPDEDGYYYRNTGTFLPDQYSNGDGSVMSCANDFGNGDSNSLFVKCGDEYFLFDNNYNLDYSVFIGDVGKPKMKGFDWKWDNSFDNFSWGPAYPPDEDYHITEMTYNISADIYNCSDTEAEITMAVPLPGFGPSILEKEDYKGNIICKKVIPPHEWTTLSNPCFDCPKALEGGIRLYTKDAIEFYIDNITVSEPENVSKVKGDINGDGVLDSLDLIQYRKSFIEQNNLRMLPRRADIDGDGNVLINDMVLLRKYLLGTEKEFAAIKETAPDKTESTEKDGTYCESFVKAGIGNVDYKVGEKGSYECSFDSTDNASFEYGIITDTDVPIKELKTLYHVYDADIKADDGYLFGLHGTFRDSDDEFYIIEASVHDNRFAAVNSSYSFSTEGYQYSCTVLTKTKDTPEGKVTYNEYWSVMNNYYDEQQDVKSMYGQINILRHLKELENLSGVRITDKKLGRLGSYVSGTYKFSPSFKVERSEFYIE